MNSFKKDRILDPELCEDLKSFAYEFLADEEMNLALDIAHYCRFISGDDEKYWPSFKEFRELKRQNPGYSCGGPLYKSWRNTLIERGVLIED